VTARDAQGRALRLAGYNTDITPRKLAELALADSEERFRATFKQAAVGIFHADLNGHYLRVNRKFCEITGYTEEELTGPSRPNLSHPDDLDSGGADRKRLLAGEITSHSNEKRYVRKDGRVIWVNRTESVARDEAGNPLYLIRVIEEVTERKRAEEAVVHERVLLRTIIDTVPEYIYVKDEQGRFLLANRSWLKVRGSPDDDIAGKTVFDFFPRDIAEKMAAQDADIVKSGAPMLEREQRIILNTPDGTQDESESRWAAITKVPMRDLSGNIIGTVGVSRDITERKRAEEALRTSEERYRDVFEASPLPMWVWDDETLDIVAVNQAAVEHYGYSRDEFLRMNVREIWAPDEAARYEGTIRDRTQQQALQLQRRHRTKDGRILDIEVTARMFSLGGRPVWLTVINDVSVRVLAEAALRESEEQFRQLAGNIPQVFWITDTSHRQTLYVSPAAESMLGRPLPDILSDSRALVRAVHKEDRARVYAARKTAIESGYDETYRILRPDGSIRWVHDRAFPVRDGDGRIYRIAGIAEDVTDRKLAEERLEHLAHYDTLTNLPNRALFYDRLKQTLAQARRNRWTMGVMFLDADRFKNVNDTLGHAVGDQLLQQIARRLTQSVRSDDTVGRLGGDEFAIVLSTLASAQDATLVAQKIMEAFKEPFRLEGTEVYVTASIGITLYPDDSSDHDVLIKNADTAMYRAKEIGRNSYQFYTPEMNARAIELLGMESSLRRALERDEFLLHYQPKASVADGDITGLEALLRWKHPERGLVSPAEFIPLLEESGLIIQVGEWVLKAVCSQIKAWERAGNRSVPVSVNLSARQFAANDLGPTIKRILEEHQVDPALIECEITESALMANTGEAVRTLEYLDRLGVGLAIDDFGTGYSSLGYLKRFPISALKIDRSFVRDVTTDGDDATITRAVISMAHSLGLKVIAEGVETRAQLEFLAEYGCNEIQGYYFARPMPAEDCGAWVREQRRLERPRPASDVRVPVVLLLDDDDDTLAYLERVLARDGYRILAARNAREGLALLRDYRVDVVVSDQNMPGMSGVEFLQRVQTLSPRTMRILTTGFADFQTMADAVNKGGIFRCLPKDIGDEALRDNVREAVQARIHALENSIPPGALRM
jgi:diguanylate cyclase (GGDEF)-like protein/PAS domain S-box-containing protein